MSYSVSSGVSMTIDARASALNAHLLMLATRNLFDGDLREDIGEYLVGEVQDNLDHQRLFDGTPMEQSKAAIERDGKTLIAIGHHLYDSYTYQLINGGVEIGSNSAYARIHHFGGETGRRGHRFMMPARPVLGVGPEQDAHISSMILAHLDRMTQGLSR